MLDTNEAAARVGLAPGHLRNLRSQGKGPRFHKADTGRCYYTAADLDAYLAEHPRRAASVARRVDPSSLVEALIAAGVTAVVLHGNRGPGKTWGDVTTAREVAR